MKWLKDNILMIGLMAMIIVITIPTQGAITDPHAIYGYVLNENNSPVPNASIIAKNLRTGETLSSQTDNEGRYLIQLANFPSGYENGDTIEITVNNTYIFNVVVDTSVGNQFINLKLNESAEEGQQQQPSNETESESPLSVLPSQEGNNLCMPLILFILIIIGIATYIYYRNKKAVRW